MRRIAFLLCLTVLLAGCNDKSEILEPLGPSGIDYIKLSAKELLFDNTTSVQEVTTEGNFWWLEGNVYIDDKYVGRGDPTLKIETGTIDGFNLRPTILRIEGEWFTITRPEIKRIGVCVKANPTPKERTLILPLTRGNSCQTLTIKQKGT